MKSTSDSDISIALDSNVPDDWDINLSVIVKGRPDFAQFFTVFQCDS